MRRWTNLKLKPRKLSTDSALQAWILKETLRTNHCLKNQKIATESISFVQGASKRSQKTWREQLDSLASKSFLQKSFQRLGQLAKRRRSALCPFITTRTCLLKLTLSPTVRNGLCPVRKSLQMKSSSSQPIKGKFLQGGKAGQGLQKDLLPLRSQESLRFQTRSRQSWTVLRKLLSLQFSPRFLTLCLTHKRAGTPQLSTLKQVKTNLKMKNHWLISYYWTLQRSTKICRNIHHPPIPTRTAAKCSLNSRVWRVHWLKLRRKVSSKKQSGRKNNKKWKKSFRTRRSVSVFSMLKKWRSSKNSKSYRKMKNWKTWRLSKQSRLKMKFTETSRSRFRLWKPSCTKKRNSSLKKRNKSSSVWNEKYRCNQPRQRKRVK